MGQSQGRLRPAWPLSPLPERGQGLLSRADPMQRDWRVDTLRGWFLICMMSAHLPRHGLQKFTEYTFGYASAPDGFIFLSGMTCAWVYLRFRSKHGHAAMSKRIRRRVVD